MHTLEDGHYFSPDLGDFVVRNDVAYFEDGDVLDLEEGLMLRCMPTEPGEDYSKWTDEKRKKVLAHHAAEIRKEKKEEKAYENARNAIVKKAKKRLTEEEFDAICEWAVEGDRYGPGGQGDID